MRRHQLLDDGVGDALVEQSTPCFGVTSQTTWISCICVAAATIRAAPSCLILRTSLCGSSAPCYQENT
jgi:hypothetical protein